MPPDIVNSAATSGNIFLEDIFTGKKHAKFPVFSYESRRISEPAR
jgi:hypothetical protein